MLQKHICLGLQVFAFISLNNPTVLQFHETEECFLVERTIRGSALKQKNIQHNHTTTTMFHDSIVLLLWNAVFLMTSWMLPLWSGKNLATTSERFTIFQVFYIQRITGSQGPRNGFVTLDTMYQLSSGV